MARPEGLEESAVAVIQSIGRPTSRLESLDVVDIEPFLGVVIGGVRSEFDC
jgi:hypothetical protein